MTVFLYITFIFFLTKKQRIINATKKKKQNYGHFKTVTVYTVQFWEKLVICNLVFALY